MLVLFLTFLRNLHAVVHSGCTSLHSDSAGGLPLLHINSVQFLWLWVSRVWLFTTLWTVACQASLSITNSRSSPRLISIESVMPSNHLTYLSEFFVVCLFYSSHFGKCEVIAHCGFNLYSMMISDIEHLFMCLLAICMSLEKCLFRSLLIF